MIKNNELQAILTEQNVAKENAGQLLAAFGAPFEEAGKILSEYKTIVVTEEDQTDLMADARSKRLALKNIRVDVEKKRKELKENSLRTGRAIDSVAKFVKETIEPAEKYLELQEKFVEIRQSERAAKLKAERVEQLAKYMSDPAGYYNLDNMTDEQFIDALQSAKSVSDAKEAELKRIEEEHIAEEKAKAEEYERVRAENERIKKDTEEREALHKKRGIERSKQLEQIGIHQNEVVFGFRISGLDLVINDDEQWEALLGEAKRRIKMDKDKKEADRREEEERQAEYAKLRAEREAEQKAAQAKLDEERKKSEAEAARQQVEHEKKLEAERKMAAIEREKREKLEQEQRAARLETERRAAEQEETKRQSLLAPDKEKLIAFADIIDHLDMPNVANREAGKLLDETQDFLNRISRNLRSKAKEL